MQGLVKDKVVFVCSKFVLIFLGRLFWYLLLDFIFIFSSIPFWSFLYAVKEQINSRQRLQCHVGSNASLCGQDLPKWHWRTFFKWPGLKVLNQMLGACLRWCICTHNVWHTYMGAYGINLARICKTSSWKVFPRWYRMVLGWRFPPYFPGNGVISRLGLAADAVLYGRAANWRSIRFVSDLWLAMVDGVEIFRFTFFLVISMGVSHLQKRHPFSLRCPDFRIDFVLRRTSLRTATFVPGQISWQVGLSVAPPWLGRSGGDLLQSGTIMVTSVWHQRKHVW